MQSTIMTEQQQQMLERQRTAEIAATLVDVASITNANPPQVAMSLVAQQQQHATKAATETTSNTTPPPSYITLLSMIGMGTDCNSDDAEATNAAVKAVRDAVERLNIGVSDGVSSSAHHRQQYRLHIRLGAPVCQKLHQVMRVDPSRLRQALPPNIPLLPVDVETGGLRIPPQGNNNSSTCVVVACVSLQQQVQQLAATAVTMSSPTSVTTSNGSSPVRAPPQVPFSAIMPMTLSQQPSPGQVLVPKTWAEVEQQQQQQQQQVKHNFRPLPMMQQQQKQEAGKFRSSDAATYERTNSMDMLARISAEMIAGEDNIHSNIKSSSNREYKKLPPGTTPKNHTRLFVKHSYRDYSHEKPAPDEVDLLPRTPNAIFPLKLHEVLSQIENDGMDSIIGWLPHGRSFKIHKQKEFVDIILPKYFVMTKKSSFLRQLNLYGFNRLSGLGPDQGSYYHERFLRGMKFLAKRMQRQKVNGNGIRAAGNPDEEPNLSRYPICPLVLLPRHNKVHINNGVAVSSGSSSSLHNTRGKTKKVGTPPTVTLGTAATVAANNQFAAAAAATQEPLVVEPNSNSRSPHGGGGGAPSLQASFPLKLQRILDKLEAEGKTDVVAWLSHGRAFQVYDTDRFVNELMPVYFNQTKYSSFQRQLHMYNFQRITAGRDKGAYHHPNFQRGRPDLSIKMQRTRVNGKGTRRPGNPDKEPDLYSLEPMPAIAPGTVIAIPLDLPPSAGIKACDSTGDDSGSWDES